MVPTSHSDFLTCIAACVEDIWLNVIRSDVSSPFLANEFPQKGTLHPDAANDVENMAELIELRLTVLLECFVFTCCSKKVLEGCEIT